MNDPILAIGGGNSSIEVNRNAKGDYTWGAKFYFLGHDMATVKHILENVGKTRMIIEAMLGQDPIPTEDMSVYMRKLTKTLESATRKKTRGKDDKDTETTD